MKRLLSTLLVLAMLLSLSVSAFADSSVTKDGKNIYSESTEIVEGDLYDALYALYEGTDYGKLVQSDVKTASGATRTQKVSINSTAVDESSIGLTLDGTTPVAAGSDAVLSLAAGSHSVSIRFAYHAEYTIYKNSFSSTVVGTGSYDGFFSGSSQKFNFSIRLKTEIQLEKSSVSYVYGTENPAQLILDTVMPTVTLTDGTVIDSAAVTVVDKLSTLNAGRHTVTLKYAGLDNGTEVGYQPSTKEITVNITKIPSNIKVGTAIVRYDGEEHMPEVTVTPENAPYTLVTLGIERDAVGFASIYMSEGSSLYNTLLFLRNSGDTLARYAKLLGFDISDFVFGSDGLSLEQLRNMISGLSNIAGLLKYVGINLDDTQIAPVLEALDYIGNIMDTLHIDANFYIANMPKDQGEYITYAVISEENYTTSFSIGSTTILVDRNATMQWKQSTEGQTFTKDDLKDFDFSAFVTSDGTTALKGADIHYTITGFASDGSFFSSDSLDNLPTMPGTYTETAYCTKNYSATALRVFTVNKYPAYVKFVGADGHLTDAASIDTAYDGDPHGLTAVVVDRNDMVIDGATVTYSYTGTTKTGVRYSSSEAPFDSGDYTLKVSFAGNADYTSASATATVVIHKAAASITFGNITSRILQKVDYSKVSYTYEGMSADDAARIAATLNCGSKIHLLIGSHKISCSVPEDISARYDVTVNAGKHTVKLFYW